MLQDLKHLPTIVGTTTTYGLSIYLLARTSFACNSKIGSTKVFRGQFTCNNQCTEKDTLLLGWINYWSPQISTVSFFEGGDPVCGDGVCGGWDHRNQTEDCHSCPQDCGTCPIPTCGNGVCEYGETWAPSVRFIHQLYIYNAIINVI